MAWDHDGMFNIKHNLILFALILMLMVTQPLFTDVFSSTSFARQEMLDNKRDWIDKNSNIINGSDFTDLVTITYLSDGKNFNATFWLSGVFIKKPSSDMALYGILIDADANSKTGLSGFDYATKIIWDGQSWTKQLEEMTRFNNVRVLNMEKNFTGFFDKIGKTVRLSFDLESMGSPEQYSVAFFTVEEKEIESSEVTLYDFSSLVNVPPPEFFVSTSPESIILKQGEKKIVQVQVKSTTGFQPQIALLIERIDNISLTLASDQLIIPSFGLAATPLEIKVSKDAPPGPHVLIIYATATFPLNKMENLETDTQLFLALEEKFVVKKIAPLTVIVQKFTIEDSITEFMDKWEVLIIALTTLATGGVLFSFKNRISRFFRKTLPQDITTDSGK